MTDESGEATVILQSGRTAGTVRVAARYGGIQSNALAIPVQPGPPQTLHCWPAAATIAEDDTTTIFVVVRDANRNPVADSTVVTFSVGEGWVIG